MESIMAVFSIAKSLVFVGLLASIGGFIRKTLNLAADSVGLALFSGIFGFGGTRRL